jgi:uncharacterized protein
MPDELQIDFPSDYKSVALEMKAEGDEGKYQGHFSIFENIDDGGDIIHAGAFAKTIQERKKRMKVFYAHDWMKLIGPPPSVLQEDSLGLYAEGKLTLDSFWGKEVWALMKDEALTEGSIGYRPVKWQYEDNDDQFLRHLYELKLYEISPVPLGMNPLTNVEAVKMLLRARDPREKIEVFTALVKSLTDTDITEENAEAWQQAAREVADRLASFSESSEASAVEPQKHSTLLSRRLRLRAAELALSQSQFS